MTGIRIFTNLDLPLWRWRDLPARMILRRLRAPLAAAGLGLGLRAPSESEAPPELAALKARGPPASPAGSRYRLRWCDDFDYVGHPDAARWNHQVESNNWVRDERHNELQWYTARRKENAWVEDGVLRITARREDAWQDAPYTSARLTTKGKGDWCGGRIEVTRSARARARAPRVAARAR